MDFADKTVLFYDSGIFLSWAETLTKYFGRVLLYVPYKSQFVQSTAMRIGYGIPNVEHINPMGETKGKDFWDVVNEEEIDLFIFLDIGDSDIQAQLKRMGKRVWGSGNGDDLELFRPDAKATFERLGLPQKAWETCVGSDDLRNVLKRATEPLWVKVSGHRGDIESFRYNPKWPEDTEQDLRRLEDKLGRGVMSRMEFCVEEEIPDAVEVGYDGPCVDGEFPVECMVGVEEKDASYFGIVSAYEDLPEQMRRVNTALSPLLARYEYRNFMSTEIRIPDDLEPYVVDMTCFSEDTEILTSSGWKRFQSLLELDRVATLNPVTNELQYQFPTRHLSYRFNGEMVLITNAKKSIECLVTPDHRVWRTDRHKKRLFSERADALTDKGFIPRTAEWSGIDPEFYTVPEYTKIWHSGRGRGLWRTHKDKCTVLSMSIWLQFLALYLSEGSMGNRKHQVNIAQTKRVADCAEILRQLPWKISKRENGFEISSVQLCDHLRGFGLCDKKFVPDYVKELSPRLIRIFLNAYLIGDGTTGKGHQRYYTTSKRMADDLQELILKVGNVADIMVRPTKGTWMSQRGKSYRRNHDIFVIGERLHFKDFWFETKGRKSRYIQKIPYSGMVYDVTVPNGIVFVRRHGKAFWSGNCRAPSPPSEGYQEIVENFPEIFWYGAEGILVPWRFKHKYLALAIIHSDEATTSATAVRYPDSIRSFVKLKNYARIDGVDWVLPQPVPMKEVGAVIGTSDDPIEAIRLVHERAGQTNQKAIVSGIAKAISSFREGIESGVEFTGLELPDVTEIAKATV